uniref:Diacylglycerol kinase n=1 Tax=Kalanchoe fedtschenkoi TaxID=63787 RepID=A0A7N0ZYA6_KALFE
MESPTAAEVTGGGDEKSGTRIAARTSVLDSLRGCGLSGVRIDKEELKRELLLPLYLRQAMLESIRAKDARAGVSRIRESSEGEGEKAPEGPMVIFVNSKSGGRYGPVLKERLQVLMGQEQVFDLWEVKPHEFVQYGLGCLEKMAEVGDICAKETRDKMRVMVAGGDGTVGWVLGCLGELSAQGRHPMPPVGIIPLGTGNDLSRSFGWGGSFPFAWKSAIKRSLQKAISGPICRLDSWNIIMSSPGGAKIETPYSLKLTEDCNFDQGLDMDGDMPEKVNCYDGVFYNYFSIGMDAQVAYGFHHLRNEKPYLAQGPISNKLIYSGYTCSQGWFFTPCRSDPSLRGLKNIMRMHVKKVNCSEWEQIDIPKSVRAIVALNLHNYAGGRNPWGNLKPEYMEKRGFSEAHADDGLLEVFGLKQGWHASFVMVELITAKHMAQAASIRFELRGGEWRKAYMQMDGEPWKQPIDKEFSTFVEIKRVPHQSLVINGE